ncbi:nucleotidyltransferase domain-containing protein [Patescibacteria group bacterium]|nr:nucleotidyltransferase domain-containing protein [Patescibacteria group bacterium]
MSKQQVKKNLLKAITKDSIKDDIKRVSLFGSYVYGKPNKNSDLDVLVEFMPKANVGFFKLAQIQRSMKKAVAREVDVVTPNALSKFFEKEVLKKAETIYEK